MIFGRDNLQKKCFPDLFEADESGFFLDYSIKAVTSILDIVNE